RLPCLICSESHPRPSERIARSMTAPETDDIIPPRDPAAFSQRRGRGTAIVAVSALAVICVALGFGAAQFADRFESTEAPPAAVPAIAPTPVEAPPALPAPSLAGAPALPPVTS